MQNYKYVLEVDSSTENQFLSIINEYWEIVGNKFVNLPSSIEIKYDIDRQILLDIIQKNSVLKLFANCINCEVTISGFTKSQSDFKSKLRSFDTLKCTDCKQKESVRVIELQKKQDNYVKNRMLLAITEQRWEQLNEMEFNILKSMLQFQDFKAFTKSEHPKYEKKFFWRTIFHLEGLFLIYLKKSETGFIIGYKTLFELKERIGELKIKKVKTEHVILDKLNFRLVKNKIFNEFDESEFSGIITFNQEIILKPNTKYSYGVWNKLNGDMHISIIPLNELESKPKQHSLSNEPIHIQEALREYYKYIKTRGN